jgi:hypothetical protein
VLAVSVGELDSFTRSLAEEIEFRPSYFAASGRFDIDDIGRMQRENSLDAFVIHDSSYREGLVDAAALAANDGDGKDLHPLLVALSDPTLHVDRIAYFKMRYAFFEAFAFYRIEHFSFHFYSPCKPSSLENPIN